MLCCCSLTQACILIDFRRFYNTAEVHFLVDEMVQNGFIVETNKSNILRPIALMERENQKVESMFR
jgi:AP-4 complex subunit sigma-1